MMGEEGRSQIYGLPRQATYPRAAFSILGQTPTKVSNGGVAIEDKRTLTWRGNLQSPQL